MFSKKDLSKTLALSCVEGYFLAWINAFMNLDRLYCASFISLKQVFEDFSNGAKYENYTGVPRIQEFSERYKITAHRYISDDEANRFSAGAARKLVRENENGLCLLRVNDKFFGNGKLRPWRGDHYVAVDNEMHWINGYPLSEGFFGDEKFSEVFGGAMLIYRFLGEGAGLLDFNAEEIKEQSFDCLNSDMSLSAFQGAVGVLRVTRKRIARFYKDNKEAAEILKDEIAILDKLYLEAELAKLRSGESEIKNPFSTVQIILCEKRLAEAIK